MSTSGTLRVLIVDDHQGFRRELRDTLARQPDLQVLGEASNGADAIVQATALRPRGLDLVLMDIDMPVMDGIAAAAQIVKTVPGLPVIILTVSTHDRDLFAGVDSGAVGFLNKHLSPGVLVRTLRDFRCNGSLPMSRAMASRALTHLQRAHAPSCRSESGLAQAALSSREQDVLRHIARGARDREIAAVLVVGETTVKTHVRNILRKLGARNRAEAAARLRDAHEQF